MTVTPRQTGVTARLRVESLESRSPASSLLDLAYLGLLAGDPLTATEPTSRPSLVAEASTAERLFTADLPSHRRADLDERDGRAALTSFRLPAEEPATRRADDLMAEAASPLPVPRLFAAGAPPAAADGMATAATAETMVRAVPPGRGDVMPLVLPHTESGFALATIKPVEAPNGVTHPPETQLMDGHVKSATFSGGHLITVVADPGDAAFAAPPHWYDANANGSLDEPADHSIPLGYVRGDIPVVAATFKGSRGDPSVLLPGWKFSDTILARGFGPTQTGANVELDVPATQVSVSGDEMTLAPTAMSYPLDNYVDYFQSFNISWQLSFVERLGDGERWWQDAGTSANEMFVTLAPPLDTRYYTVIHIPTVASVGSNTIEGVVAKTFAEFQTKAVQKRNPVAPGFVGPPAPDPLHYYKNWLTKAATAEDLIATRDGTCDAWADLFQKNLRQEGGSPASNIVILSPKRAEEKMAIKLWIPLTAAPNPGSGPFAGTLVA